MTIDEIREIYREVDAACVELIDAVHDLLAGAEAVRDKIEERAQALPPPAPQPLIRSLFPEDDR